ncbi:hypothetical protein VTK56DRAFT_2076 [Thermocarpiscus australiensis]
MSDPRAHLPQLQGQQQRQTAAQHTQPTWPPAPAARPHQAGPGVAPRASAVTVTVATPSAPPFAAVTDLLTDGAKDTKLLKYKTSYQPVPDGVDESYWNAVYNRADWKVYNPTRRLVIEEAEEKGYTSDDADPAAREVAQAAAKFERATGGTYRRALRTLVRDVVECLKDNKRAGARTVEKRARLRGTRAHLHPRSPSPLILFLRARGIVLARSTWPGAAQLPKRGRVDPDLGWEWASNVTW